MARCLHIDTVSLAEELTPDFSKVNLEACAPRTRSYGNPLFGIQATGNRIRFGSGEVGAHCTAPVRRACWSGCRRAMAARSGSCTTAKAEVMHRASGRQLAYGALGRCRARGAPKDVPLKDPRGFRADRKR